MENGEFNRPLLSGQGFEDDDGESPLPPPAAAAATLLNSDRHQVTDPASGSASGSRVRPPYSNGKPKTASPEERTSASASAPPSSTSTTTSTSTTPASASAPPDSASAPPDSTPTSTTVASASTPPASGSASAPPASAPASPPSAPAPPPSAPVPPASAPAPPSPSAASDAGALVLAPMGLGGLLDNARRFSVPLNGCRSNLADPAEQLVVALLAFVEMIANNTISSCDASELAKAVSALLAASDHPKADEEAASKAKQLCSGAMQLIIKTAEKERQRRDQTGEERQHRYGRSCCAWPFSSCCPSPSSPRGFCSCCWSQPCLNLDESRKN